MTTIRNCTGIVRWFNRLKGFGFIQARGIPGDIFVHFQQIEDDGPKGYRNLYEHDRVTFTAIRGPKGWYAENVSRQNRQ